MVRAHAGARAIKRVTIYGRSPAKVQAMIAALAGEPFETMAAVSVEDAVRSADIVCCATTATSPIVHGAWLQPGVHLDLVG
jgi:ornithine cyclodeaminase